MIITLPAAASPSGLERQELEQVQLRLSQSPYVPVVVEVLQTTLSQMSQQGEAIAAQARQQAQALLSELSGGALREGLHVGGNGMATLYINQQGLQRLKASKRATWFALAPEWYHREPFTRDPADLQRLHEAASAPGGAEIVVTLNVEGLGHNFSPDGSLTLSPVAVAATRSLASDLRQVVAHRPTSQAYAALTAFERGEGSATAAHPAQVRMLVGLRELLAITAHRAVRDVALTADAALPSGLPRVDAEIAEAIKSHGVADVVILLKRPLPMGRLSAVSERAHVESVQRTIDSVKSAARGAPLLHGLALLDGLFGQVGAQELALLRSDARIAQISLARVLLQPAIDTANSIINFPLVWNSVVGSSPLRGQGATVVIMDTGMQTDLNHFYSASRQGAHRVTRQRCFGTNGFAYSSPVVSICPPPLNAKFDSSVPLAGHFSLETCPYTNNSDCNHGSHVAALAAGQRVSQSSFGYNYTASHLSGAYEADIWAYNVASRYTGGTNLGRAAGAPQDFADALTDVIQNTTPNTTANKVVVNLSWAATCTSELQLIPEYQLIQTAVSILHARGVPVVAATGNDGSRTSLSFPSCVPKIIKVGSVPNSQAALSGTASPAPPAYFRTSHLANFDDPLKYAGDYIFAVPGGGNTLGLGQTNTNLSLPTIVATPLIPPAISGFALRQGTSYAAPLISGAYAIYKAAVPSASVYEMSVWFTSPGRRYPVQDADLNQLNTYNNNQYRFFHGLRFESLQ